MCSQGVVLSGRSLFPSGRSVRYEFSDRTDELELGLHFPDSTYAE